MSLLNSPSSSGIPIFLSSPSKRQGCSCGCFPNRIGRRKFNQRTSFLNISRRPELVVDAAAWKGGLLDVPFPSDYSELLEQAKEATELALKNNRQLMEIEFPTAGLDSVPGDGEGGIEMTGSMQLLREFCDLLVRPEKATRTRIVGDEFV